MYGSEEFLTWLRRIRTRFELMGDEGGSEDSLRVRTGSAYEAQVFPCGTAIEMLGYRLDKRKLKKGEERKVPGGSLFCS